VGTAESGRLPAGLADEAWRNALLWHEHTWGAAASISQPDRKDVVDQWEYKRAFAVHADELSREVFDGAAPPPGDTIEVINTLTCPDRDSSVCRGPVERRHRVVIAAGNRVLPSQRLLDGRLAVWIENVSPLGSVRLRVSAERRASRTSRSRWSRPASTRAACASRSIREPARLAACSGARPQPATAYRLGRLQVPLFLGRLVGPRLPDGRHHVAPGQRGTEGDPDRQGLFNYLYVPGRDPAQVQFGGKARASVTDRGPLVATIRVESDAPGASGLVRVIQLIAGSDVVSVTATLDKRRVRTKESAHFALPFSIPDGVIRLDEGDALVEPGRNQLPGSCVDFAGVHSAADVSGRDYGVSVATLDAPLVEIGAITDERLGSSGTRAWPERRQRARRSTRIC